MGKYVVYGLDGDPGVPVLAFVPTSSPLGSSIIVIVGVGNPYWAYLSLSSTITGANDIGADWTGAPVCDSDSTVNDANLADQYANPAATFSAPPDPIVAGVWKVD